VTAVELHVQEHPSERADAPLVVLVHGLLDSSRSFERAVELLVPDFMVVTYDRRRWGRSRDLDRPETFEQHVADLVAVMDGRRGTLVGHSFGGAVSLVTAARHPELVTSLGVFEPSLSWTEVWPPRAYIKEQQRTYERGHFGAGLDGRPRRTREEKQRDLAETDHEVGLLERVDLTFAEIAAPTLVGRGELSAPWRYDVTDWLAGQLRAEIVVVGGAAHTAHRVQPEGFAEFARSAAALAPA
jgi:pimeloyl-ACP methyl ester carboxylesterase